MLFYEVSKQDILHNYTVACQNTDAKVIPVLKADAYGMGAVAVREILQAAGADTFAVSRIDEADEIAVEGITVMVLSVYHDAEAEKEMVQKGYVLSVDSLSQAKRIAQMGVADVKVQIAVDTGFGRYGFLPSEIEDIAAVYALENLQVVGIFSHFSAAFLPRGKSAPKQLRRFLTVVEQLEQKGITVGVRHIANSSALVRGKEYHLDAVRVGSMLCGRLPMPCKWGLRRVGTLYGHIEDIRLLPKGHNIGYGDVYTLKKDTKVAVVPCGTTDGLQLRKDYDTFRLIDILRYGFGVFKMLLRDNRMRVDINGKKATVLGRVALTHVMIDVSDIDVKVGDQVSFPVSPLMVSPRVSRIYK